MTEAIGKKCMLTSAVIL